MEVKLKKCSRCKKDKPIFKNKTIEGEKKQFCQTCWGIVNREVAKEKRKVKREKKRENIVPTKLQPLVNRLSKEIYPLFCHSCYCKLEKGSPNAHGCHFISATKAVTRFDPRNILPGCNMCNFYDQSHTYELGKNINKYWGEGTAETLREMSTQTFKWSREQLFQIKELVTNPPQGQDLEQTRQLILEQYLKIKG